MILLDYSQIVIANVMTNPKDMGVDFIRHLVLNTIRMYNQKFKEEYGDLIICCDGSNNWRRGYFEHYKASRKTTRDKSEFDWNELFRILHLIREELDEYFPYKVLHLDGAEADDIISSLTIYTSENKVMNGLFEEPEPVLILSSDKDFQQLQKFENVKQYSPLKKKFIKTSNPKQFLKEHIMRGDTSDGVPNFLSDDDAFVSDNKRQKPLSSKKLSVWLELDPEEFCEGEMLRNYRRNEMLIDLTKIPTKLYDEIINTYVNKKDVGRGKFSTILLKIVLKI
jgi:5'-3' exonuclease